MSDDRGATSARTSTGTPGDLVDWADAATVAGRLAPPGPVATRREIDELVTSLHSAAVRAVAPVVTLTELLPADGRDLSTAPLSGVRVVDRPRWAQAGAASMREMTGEALRSPGGRRIPLPAELAASAEVGAVLSFMSTRILGQFDPYADPSRNLLLVAPNVLQVERRLQVRPEDFRLWVCLHEQTHALQFAAAPWLADHLRERTRALVGGLTETSSGPWQTTSRVATLVRAVYTAVRGLEGPSVLDGVLDPQQRAVLDEISGIMSLLEGHADVVMDGVGPSVVPTVRTIRKKFAARRDTDDVRSRVARRLLGMDVKLAQYRDGAAFVRSVTRSVGTSGLNAVWTSPQTLPSLREIADPVAWVRRVHG